MSRRAKFSKGQKVAPKRGDKRVPLRYQGRRLTVESATFRGNTFQYALDCGSLRKDALILPQAALQAVKQS